MTMDYNNFKYFLSTEKLNGRQAREERNICPSWTSRPCGHQDPADTLSRRPDYGDGKSGIVKSGTADAAMLPVLQNLIRDQESDSKCSARDARESGSLI